MLLLHGAANSYHSKVTGEPALSRLFCRGENPVAHATSPVGEPNAKYRFRKHTVAPVGLEQLAPQFGVGSNDFHEAVGTDTPGFADIAAQIRELWVTKSGRFEHR